MVTLAGTLAAALLLDSDTVVSEETGAARLTVTVGLSPPATVPALADTESSAAGADGGVGVGAGVGEGVGAGVGAVGVGSLSLQPAIPNASVSRTKPVPRRFPADEARMSVSILSQATVSETTEDGVFDWMS
jgi:hypothetical protein